MDMSHSPNKDDLMSSTCLHHSKKLYSICELSVSRVVSTCANNRSVPSTSVNAILSAPLSMRFCCKSRKFHPMLPAKTSTSTATMIPIFFLFMFFFVLTLQRYCYFETSTRKQGGKRILHAII